jgi:hypothetical protein
LAAAGLNSRPRILVLPLVLRLWDSVSFVLAAVNPATDFYSGYRPDLFPAQDSVFRLCADFRSQVFSRSFFLLSPVPDFVLPANLARLDLRFAAAFVSRGRSC